MNGSLSMLVSCVLFLPSVLFLFEHIIFSFILFYFIIMPENPVCFLKEMENGWIQMGVGMGRAWEKEKDGKL